MTTHIGDCKDILPWIAAEGVRAQVCEQQAFIDRVNGPGGLAFIARSADDAIAALRAA